jgi:hypothetical protein
MPDRSRRAAHLIVGVLAASSILAVGTMNSPSVSAAATYIDAGGLAGHVGVDYGTGNYASVLRWRQTGPLENGCDQPPCNFGGPGARYEFYPHTGFGANGQPNYDPWVGDVGSVHIDSTGGNVFNLGTVTLPRVGVSVGGSYPAVRLDGDILSSTPVPDGRVSVNSFQVPTVYPDPERPLPSNGSVLLGSFSSGANRGNRWTAGVGWPGRYILFVTDNTTGRAIQVFQDLGFAATPTIDLDAICFGFDVCQYNAGGPGTTAGSFHPTAPTRILDTRFGVGIAGPIRSGGGKYDTDDPNVRRAETANHELKVTGVGGVPEAGVSAVLLNVTAVVPPGPGYVAVTPKGPHCCSGLAIFDDQASVPAGEPATSNLNVAGGDIVPNLVLARVGAGGKIRIYNWWGPTEMVADIAGWIGTGGAHTNGSGFAGVTPARVLDSRNNIGTTKGIFAANETRDIKVTGVAGVPTNAVSVVVNITVTQPQGSGFATAFPKGVALPTASNLNYVAGTTRANLAVVKVGTGGVISLNAAETSAHLIVDVMGSFGPYGGRIEAIDPVRLVDTRNSTGPMVVDAPAVIPVRGRAGVPADATAVILNVTAANPHGFGYFTIWPTGVAEPSTSNVNFVGGQNVPNMVMVKLGADGTITVKDSVNRSDLIIDVFGFVR